MSSNPDEMDDVEEIEAGLEIRSLLHIPEQEEVVAPELQAEIEGSELAEFESAPVENQPHLEPAQVDSVLESFLFANDKPVSMNQIRQIFKGTNVKTADIKKSITRLTTNYMGVDRGLTLEEIGGGFQLRTKVENRPYLQGQVRSKVFRLSGPALEVLSIVAYKQPCVKMQVDEIRGVESGHLLRGLMERGIVEFSGKSELPGKPMLYGTTRKFLEIFSLRNIEELPSLAEIDDLIPEGIGDFMPEKESLGDVTDSLSKDAGATYSEGEEELLDITDALKDITTTTEFFEREKDRMKAEDERKRAEDLRQTLMLGGELAEKDRKWLDKYDKRIAAHTPVEAASVAASPSDAPAETAGENTGE